MDRGNSAYDITKGEVTMTIKYTKQEQLAIDTANGIVAVGTAQASIDANCKAIHKLLKGNKLGTVKSGDAVNAEKFRESYAQLAAFIIDALDEYVGQ